MPPDRQRTTDDGQRTIQREVTNSTMDRSVKIIVTLVVLLVVGFFAYNKIVGWHRQKIDTAVKKEQTVWQKKTGELKREVTSLKKELTTVKGQDVPEETLAAVFGEKKEKTQAAENKDLKAGKKPGKRSSFTEIERKVMAFFHYLDDQPYIQSRQPAGGTYHQYEIAMARLSAKPPIVTGEMDSLYSMVRNVAHFYRVLGKNRILLIKQILKNESAVIEPAMKTFYQWFSTDDKGRATLQGRPGLETQYVYAGYLLNTLGGRSYLLRRGSRVRTLTTYYCVLVLDRANDAQLNSAGIDIRPYIKASTNEITNQLGLRYQKEYLARLDRLSRKYP